MKKQKPELLNQIIFVLFILLLAISPLIVFPWTSELFEIPKMFFVYAVTALIVSIWLLQIPLIGKFNFRKTPLDIPILLFLASQILATIFSIHPYTSIWGWYTRLNGGLASTIVYIFLYYALVSNLRNKQIFQLIKVLLLIGFLVSLYGIGQHFGVDASLWVQDVQSRIFSTLGQPNWLAAYVTILLPLSYVFLLNKKTFYTYLLPTLLFLTLIYTRSRSGFLAFGISYVIFWGVLINKRYDFKNKIQKRIVKTFWLLIALLVVLSAFFSTPFTPTIFNFMDQSPQKIIQSSNVNNISPKTENIQQGGTPSGDIRKIVWKGAWKLGKQYPIFGTGPETFGYTYYWVRPVAHNLVSEWDFLYNKAHNEYLNFWANTGSVGLISYLVLVGWFVYLSLQAILRNSIKRKEEVQENLFPLAFLASFVAILVTNFFGFSVVIVELFFFLIPGFWVVLNNSGELKEIKVANTFSFRFVKGFILVAILGFSSMSLFFVFQMFKADLEYNKAENLLYSNHQNEALPLIKKAISRRPKQADYHDLATEIYGDLALMSFATQQEESVDIFLKLAMDESKKALNLNPYHLNILKNQVGIYIRLETLDPEYANKAEDLLMKATAWAPTDAKLLYNLALLQARRNQSDLAILTLKKSLKLKPNYTDSLYAISLFLYEQSAIETDKAKFKEAVLYMKKLLQIEPNRVDAKKKLKEWQKQFPIFRY